MLSPILALLWFCLYKEVTTTKKIHSCWLYCWNYLRVVSTCHYSNWRWCHNIGYPLLAAKHSLCKAPWSATPCLMTSVHNRTVSPLDSAWKHLFSLATSVLSALETSSQLRYINSHLPLPFTITKLEPCAHWAISEEEQQQQHPPHDYPIGDCFEG